MNERIEAELALLRLHYTRVDYLVGDAMHWFRVQMLKTPENWAPAETPVVFAVTEGYPGTHPYGFYVPQKLNLEGKPPSGNDVPHPFPFEGNWRFLSWQPVGWHATANVHSGSNLWGWVRTFMNRLREGV